VAELTDLEIMKACAEALSIDVYQSKNRCGETLVDVLRNHIDGEVYDPLHNDAQCMALVKKFRRSHVLAYTIDSWMRGVGTDEMLNVIICETVAHMQQEKSNG